MNLQKHLRRARVRNDHYELLPITRLWILRLLVPLGGHRKFLSSHGFYCDRLAEQLGLGEWIDPPDGEFKSNAIRQQLTRLHNSAEKSAHEATVPACLSANIASLAQLLGLAEPECRILEFAVLMQNENALSEVADWLDELSSRKLFTVLARLLHLNESDVRAVFHPGSVLMKSGLLALEHRSYGLSSKMELLSPHFADTIYTEEADPVTLLRETVALSPAPELSLDDYVHLDKTLKVLQPYLLCAATTQRRGVNIFLYGAPGTGKTQLARVLAKELHCELFEISSEDSNGLPVKGEQRLRAYRAAQSFFARRRALMLFDEAEDVFNNGGMFEQSTAQAHKAWVNRILEDNGVPTIWLSNSSRLDPAFIRRFDLVCELPVPPRKQREHILRQTCGDLLDARVVARLSESESLAPAVVTRAASVMRTIRDTLPPDETASAFSLLINNTLEVQGHQRIREHDANRLPEIYDPRFINADVDLTQVTEGLKRSQSGRLCLYGPSGTGKTAYGRWLAEQLEMPLLVKRASDLQSPYIGECEKNIAAAFRQAEQDGALLMIDEVDSFLQDRRGAHRSWEVSQVNEMLTQMEAFSGVFVASTNLMEGLDQAALRRFDLKVEFGYLTLSQLQELLMAHCKALKLPVSDKKCLRETLNLDRTTLGDFAVVLRQSRFWPVGSAEQLVLALRQTCAIKEPPPRTIGFVQ